MVIQANDISQYKIITKIQTHMLNGKSPFAQQNKKPQISYNSIKKNRIIRSQKKLTECDYSPFKNNTIKDVKNFVYQLPDDEWLVQLYLLELKKKLESIQLSKKIYKKRGQPKECRIPTKGTTQQTQIEKPQEKPFIKNIPNMQKIARRSTNNIESRQPKICSQQRKRTRYQQDEIEQPKNDNIGSRFPRSNSDIKYRSNTEHVLRNKNQYSVKKMEPSQQKKKKQIQQKIIVDQTINFNHHINFYGLNGKEEVMNKDQQSLLKHKKEETDKIEDLSTIIAKKETLEFLSDSIQNIKKELTEEKKGYKSTNKILDFIDWRTQELNSEFNVSIKQKKKKHDLDKLSKIFPKNFFN